MSFKFFFFEIYKYKEGANKKCFVFIKICLIERTDYVGLG